MEKRTAGTTEGKPKGGVCFPFLLPCSDLRGEVDGKLRKLRRGKNSGQKG